MSIKLIPTVKQLAFIEKEFQQKTIEPLALAIDPGINCGYAATFLPIDSKFIINELFFTIGQLDLSCGTYESGPSRFVKFRHFLTIMNPSVIFYEDVRHNPADPQKEMNLAQAVARVAGPIEFFGGFKSHISEWAERRNVAAIPIPIAHIKKTATGKGNAAKEELIKAANERFGATLDHIDYEKKGHDNIADAFWALINGLENYGYGVTKKAE